LTSVRPNFALSVAIAISQHATSQRAHQRGEAFGVRAIGLLAGLGHATHPVQVGAGGECRAAPGQDDGAYQRIAIDLRQRIGKFGDQGIVERVVHARPVQHDTCDAVDDRDVEQIGHGGSSTQRQVG
jgi:hypothetical protein